MRRAAMIAANGGDGPPNGDASAIGFGAAEIQAARLSRRASTCDKFAL